MMIEKFIKKRLNLDFITSRNIYFNLNRYKLSISLFFFNDSWSEETFYSLFDSQKLGKNIKIIKNVLKLILFTPITRMDTTYARQILITHFYYRLFIYYILKKCVNSKSGKK